MIHCGRLCLHVVETKDYNIYAWQTGHQWSTNVSTYGLDRAFPGRLQPDLKNKYIRISCIWQRYADVWNGSVRVQVEKTFNGGYEHEMINSEGLETPPRKRCRLVQDVEAVEISNANCHWSQRD